MSIVKVIPYVNRLAKVVAAPGGKRVGEAIDEANANLLTIKEPCLEALDANIARIRELTAGAPGDAALEEAYERANEVLGLAGVFGLPDLGQAAYCLCELIDCRTPPAGVERQSLTVLVDSLSMLRLGEALPAAERERMVEGLIAVVAKAKKAAGLQTA